MKIAITGMHGFIGTKIVSLLSQKYEFLSLGRDARVDIVNFDTVEKAIAESDAEMVVHLAAYTNVDEAEKQKPLGNESAAWQTNVTGAENVALAAKKHGKKLIHVSTDMVFGGIEQDYYHEKDTPSPVNFYGITKYEAEKKVLESGVEATILRPAFPYTWKAEKRDFVRIFLQFFKEKKSFTAVSDCYFAPTYIDDIAKTIDLILEKKLTGVIHGASGEKLTSYEIALKIAEKFGFDKSLVSPVSKDVFFKDRAPRSKNTTLFNDTLTELGVRQHTLDQALDECPTELL